MAIAELAASGAIQTGVNSVSGLINGAINNMYQKEAENRAWQRTNEMYEKQYKDNSPLNRLKQLKEAGLNPALMYANGGSGGGAATGIMSTSSNINTSGNTFDIMSARVQEAQIANIEADAKLKEIQANKLAGADTDLINANITKINTEIDKLKADIKLKGVQAEIGEMQKNSISIANEYNMKNNVNELAKNAALVRQLNAKADVDEATIQTNINILKLNLKDIAKNIALKEANIKLTEKQIEQISNSIEINNKQIVVNENSLMNAWNIAVLNAQGGAITKDLKGVAGLLIKALKGEYSPTIDYKYYQENGEDFERRK